MFRWDDLRILLAVHRRGSAAAAARQLGIDASTAARRLRALESDLSARLFERTVHGLVPTELTLGLIAEAEQAEASLQRIEARAAGADVRPEGLVRVACSDAFAVLSVAPNLPVFLAEHPGLRIDVLASTDLVDLSRREADIAVRFVRPEQADLVARRVVSYGPICPKHSCIGPSWADRHVSRATTSS